jgi:hypothetical protein
MSDPVTNVEIEDVLSSIRKLVADDTRVSAAVPQKEPGRLVLTPAQRVKEAPKPEKFVTVRASDKAGEVEETLARKQDFPHDLPIEEIPRDARLADFGEVEGAFPDMDARSAPGTPSPEVQNDAGVELGNDAVQSSARLELGRLIEQEVAAALKDVSLNDNLSDSDSDGGEAAEDTDWDVPEEDYVADEFAADVQADFDTMESNERTVDETLSNDNDTASPIDNISDMEVHHVHVSPPQTLEDKVAALGRLVARDTNEFEDERDDLAADDLTAVAERMTWPDALPVQDEPEAAPEVASNVVHSEASWQHPIDTPDVSEDVQSEPEISAKMPVETEISMSQPVPIKQPSLQLDEDMLRDLVGDIVRQELQGALGERITRNVRKLVRREIHRMLISQELE